MRLLRTTRIGQHCSVKIYRDYDEGEFVVRTSIGSKRNDGDYFTTDMKDARGTAAAQARWAKKQAVCKAGRR